jgi:hypothetical protein
MTYWPKKMLRIVAKEIYEKGIDWQRISKAP